VPQVSCTTSGENPKAIDASRIEPRTGTADENKVESGSFPKALPSISLVRLQ
jgi:hypothetical protein